MNKRKPIKYLGINLTVEVKDLYYENFHDIDEDDRNIWEEISCCGI